ncbi:hypothetical protein HDV01_001428 [Terramyces sp. JEL0728]|nr:hypothetical protein HDV01_001428 [Terramyces sp. JEL0728]
MKLSQKTKSRLSIGIPIVASAVFGSYFLQFLFETKFKVQDINKQEIDTMENSNIKKRREKINLQKVYFDLYKDGEKDWDYKRLPRPPGQE